MWFILGGGAIFAAWPALYALSFSGFYLAMFLVLAAMILRPVGFKYRSKRPSAAWRRNWDIALCIGGAVPALIFGVALGNTLQGVPFHFTDDLRPIYEGTLFGLLNPLALVLRPRLAGDDRHARRRLAGLQGGGYGRRSGCGLRRQARARHRGRSSLSAASSSPSASSAAMHRRGTGRRRPVQPAAQRGGRAAAGMAVELCQPIRC